MTVNRLLERLRYHVSEAIERGEAIPIVEQPLIRTADEFDQWALEQYRKHQSGIRPMFEVRNEDGQVMSRHASAREAHIAAARQRLDRAAPYSCYEVFGPIHEVNRQ
jgi:hypothetical protein